MDYDKAVAFIFECEDGYVFDEDDPGGETHFGVSKRSYPNLDIKNMTRRKASDIYYHDYWLPANCNQLPDGLDLAVFDCAVNQGVSFACRLLQAIVDVKTDGKIGPVTVKACWAKQHGLIDSYLNARLTRYRRTRNYDIYGRGWENRVGALKAFLLAEGYLKTG